MRLLFEINIWFIKVEINEKFNEIKINIRRNFEISCRELFRVTSLMFSRRMSIYFYNDSRTKALNFEESFKVFGETFKKVEQISSCMFIKKSKANAPGFQIPGK